MTTDLEGKKAYFPVESLVGLGHFNRSGKIVREMIKAGMEVTVASGAFVDPGRFFAGAHCLKIPQLVRREKGLFVTLDADGKRTLVPGFNESARTEERIEAHLGNIKESKPDIVVSEFWPLSRQALDREMGKILDAGSAQKCLRLVSVRDVLDLPAEGEKTEKAAKALQDRDDWIVKTINEKFDAVLVHGDPDFIPLSETFSSAGKINVPVIYTGYVVDDLPRRTGTAADPEAPVVISCGSGVEGEEMVFSLLKAWQWLLDHPLDQPEAAGLVHRPLHIVCGPRFEPAAFEIVAARAALLEKQTGAPVKVDHYRDDFTAVLAGAAFSVSLAGYNTTLEILAMDAPALLVPKYSFQGNGALKISTEQLYRLRRLEQKNLAAYAHPDDVQDPKKFAEIVTREFSRQTGTEKPRARLNFDGAANTVAAVSGLLRDREKAPPPAPSPAMAPV